MRRQKFFITGVLIFLFTATSFSQSAQLNALSMSSVLEVGNDLKTKMTGKLSLSGEYRNEAKKVLLSGTQKERADYIFSALNIKLPESYSIDNVHDSLSKIYATINGNFYKVYDYKKEARVFLPSSMIKSWYGNIKTDSTGLNNRVTDFPEITTEELTYQLPNTRKQVLPKDYILDNALVSFKRKCTRLPGNKILIKTELSLKKNIIAASEMALLKESLKDISNYLRERLIIEMN